MSAAARSQGITGTLGGLALPVGILAIIAMMVLPLPVVLLDGAEHSYWAVDEPRLRADLGIAG